MRGAFDSIAVVEAAYRIASSDAEWLRAVSAAAEPGLQQGLGVATVYWRVGSDGVEPRAIDGSVSAALLDFIPRTYAGLPPPFVAHAFSGPPWAARVSDLPPIHALLMQHAKRDGHDEVGDVVAAQVGDGRGRGVTIGSMAAKRGQLEGHRRRTWLRVMAHVGAALRLRGRVEDGTPAATEAVLDPSGQLQHAEGSLREDAAMRDALGDAVRRMERSRGGMRRADPEQALAAWTALVEGTWSVVDWVDSDGRRYLVAHENRLRTPDPRALGAREREVAEYVVHGRSNAEIAYALGLAEGTVNRIARSALRKLGRARRTDLAALFGSPDALAAGRDPDHEVIAVRAEARSTSRWELLSKAQRDVAGLAIAGASNDDIARARGTSSRTVANLLARTYQRLGVGGRNELAALMGAPPVRSAVLAPSE